MQVAGERIVVVETDPTVTWPAKDEFFKTLRSESPVPAGAAGTVVANWFACTETAVVAFGHLIEQDVETVWLWVHVLKSHRRLGLGRLMIRLGTDQAIRYRKRTILAQVENTNEPALKILDEEEFEVQPEQHPGFTLMKKTLNWV
jgi:ribosomal protein S18 acetylase RimI-like enzyme